MLLNPKALEASHPRSRCLNVEPAKDSRAPSIVGAMVLLHRSVLKECGCGRGYAHGNEWVAARTLAKKGREEDAGSQIRAGKTRVTLIGVMKRRLLALAQIALPGDAYSDDACA